MKHGVLFSNKWANIALVFGLILGVSVFSRAPLLAQGSAGRILGSITDSNGGAISGATVTILDVARGNTRTLVTDDTGAYSAPNLLTGQYKVRAEFKGFKATERQNVVLEVGQELRVDLSLQPGEQAQTITVTEEIPLVNTTNAELGGTIQNEVINDLPLNGRNFENLLDLRPGVTKYVGNSGWTQSSNGLRPHDNFFLVEGVNSNDPWMAQSMMNAVMAAGDAGTMLPIDAIDEFKTQQNPRAEFGWKPGAVVNVGVKSGTNTIHGSAYAYGRTTAFDARNYFNTDVNGNPGCATDPVPCIKTPVELEQWGASVGGPVFKDKLFYFGNFETQHYSVGNPITHNVPDTSANPTGANAATKSLVGACQAVLNGGGTVTALSERLSGITVAGGTCTMGATPGVFPVSNGSNDLTTSLNSADRIYSGVGKIDYHLNDKNSLSGMFFMSPGQGAFVDDSGHQILASQETTQYARSIVGSVGWTYIPTSTWVNSARFGYSHYYQTFISGDSTIDPSTFGIFTGVTNSASFGFPRLRVSGFGSFQLGSSWPKTVGPDTVLQFSDSVSYLRGNHAFKFGGEVLINQSTNIVTNNTKGPLQFGGLQQFFSGTIKSANITVGDFKRNLQAEGYAAFLQDDWRVTPRLTLNLGVRYEMNTVMHEKNNLIGNFDPSVGLIQDGVGGVKGIYNGDHNNFSPRVGFAWDIGGSGKTVVRGGGGILYEQGSFDAFNALGNLLGLRTTPTGVPLYTNGNLTPTTAGGTINLGAVTYTGTALFDPANPTAGLDHRWSINDANNPLYAATPTCGDGTVTLSNGISPQPCNVLGVDRKLRTPYVYTWSLGIQRSLTNSLSLEVSYVGNHASKLLGLSDLNQPPVGSGWTPAALSGCTAAPGPTNCAPDPNAEVLAQPFHTKFPYLGYVMWLSNNNISNYNSLQVSVTQHETHGFSYVLGYTYSHALAESPDNWSFISPINSANPREIYGTTEFDVRHRFTFSTTYNIPGFKAPAQLLKGWSVNSIITLESPTPWGINDITSDFSGTNEINSPSPNGEQWNFFGNPNDFKTTKALINTNGGTGGLPYVPGFCAGDCSTSVAAIGVANLTTDQTCNTKAAALGAAAEASLATLGCYVSLNGKSVLIPAAYGSLGTTAANMFRSFPYYNVDLNVTKVIKFNERISAQFRAEFFNIFNRPEIANVFGGPGGDNTFTDPTAGAAGNSFGFRNTTPDVLSSNPVLGSGGARAMQLGLKILF